ncbi:unnamed protein product [Caenorhabditis bovis]|uniref:Uncharacterized protein n=1 Tax=Caenorhabditis bovis TaxID=2654633 RepID=A0A8S1E6T4_9PELO|nr:unnamed protein product [Caenorhabditis bovis]
MFLIVVTLFTTAPQKSTNKAVIIQNARRQDNDVGTTATGQYNFWKTTIGTLYFTLGFLGIAFNLIVISILPEVRKFVARPLAILVAIQLISSILQLFAVFVPVPYMIAVEKPYFINEIMINLPSFFLVNFQIVSFLMMMLIAVFINLKTMTPKIRIRRFDISTLGWNMTDIEKHTLIRLLITISTISLTSYIILLCHIIYRRLFTVAESVEEGETQRNSTPLKRFILHFLFSSFLFSSLLFNDSLISTIPLFLIAYWPLFCSILFDIHVRYILVHRVRGIFQAQNANAPIIIRARKNEPKLAII